MNSLFMPKEQEERDLLNLEPRSYNEGKYSLVYSGRNKIYCLDDLFGNPFEVTDRKSAVNALSVYQNKLFDAGADDAIFDTRHNDVVRTPCNNVFAMCENNGELFYGGLNKSVVHFRSKQSFLDTDSPVHALCGFDPEEKGSSLLFAGYRNKVVQVLMMDENEIIKFDSNFFVSALCAYEGKLYAGLCHKDVAEGYIYNVTDTKKVIEGDGGILGLFNYDGKLYHHSQNNYAVRDIFTGEVLFDPGMKIYAALSVPRGLMFHD